MKATTPKSKVKTASSWTPSKKSTFGIAVSEWTVAACGQEVSAEARNAFRAFIAPSDAASLRTAGIAPGDLVTLVYASGDAAPSPDPVYAGVAEIWLDKSVASGSIHMSPLHLLNISLRIGSRVAISKYSGSVFPLINIVIQPTTPLPDLDALKILAREVLRDIRYILKDGAIEFPYATKIRQFRILSFKAEDLVVIPHQSHLQAVYYFNSHSNVVITNSPSQDIPKKWGAAAVAGDSTYDAIGGLAKQIETVRKIVEVPLRDPLRFAKYSIRPPRGILLYGPPGTGKTLIARTVAAETGAHVIIINGPEIISKFYGETEERLRSIFDEAEENAPCIIFIDELDSLCPKRDSNASDLEKRVVATLLTLMDGTDSKSANGIIVMAATNRPNHIDDALRRPGRFDREIEIPIPDPDARLQILHALLRKTLHNLSDAQISQVASTTHGYVGADLAAVVREAGMQTLKRLTSEDDHGSEGSNEVAITFEDLQIGCSQVKPSVMREVMLEVPNVRWSDVGGLDDVKMRIREAVEWPLKHPEAFERFKIRPPKGILMYGPPGCSKTLMAKALATEAGLNFLAVKGPELFSKWVGESEKAVRDLFKKARAASPSVIFFDEIDAIAVRRGNDNGSVSDRVLSQLLSEMDGIEPLVNVTVIAATNRPDILDSALLRPGRMDRILYVSPPDYESRCAILRIKTFKMACSIDVDCFELARLTDGYSGAEVASVCQEAAMLALEEDADIVSVSQRHFVEAISQVTPRITAEMIAFYENFREKSGLQSI